MLDGVRRKMDGIAGADFLFFGGTVGIFPLHDTVAAEDVINLLEIGGILDLETTRRVTVVFVPVMRTVARTNLVDIEKQLISGNDSLYLACLLAEATDVLRRHGAGLDDIELRHRVLLV